jgi:anthranilate 1,2-dioxygenase large subunit
MGNVMSEVTSGQNVTGNPSAASGSLPQAWPTDGVSRIPYWVFQRDDVFQREQDKLFQGPVWNYLCLESDIPNAGDYRATAVSATPVVVTRDANGAIHAFENRCAHRGALIVLDEEGNRPQGFSCVYHAWTYDLAGTLNGVAFMRGMKGKGGGMPPDFKMSEHGPRKLRVATLFGLVFGTFSSEAPSLEDFLGETIVARIARVIEGRKLKVLGRYTQTLPNNWKLYMENVKDSYHASILHLFFTTFELNRLNYTGGVLVEGGGGHHVSFNQLDKSKVDAQYADQKIRSESDYKLADPTLLEGFDEFPDGITLQILTVFPTFVLQQIQNSIAVRQIVPKGPEDTDLNWTILGFEDDTPHQHQIRLKQANLVGPAGFISMEDGCVGGFVQRGVAGATHEAAVVEMGGHGVESSESRVTEAGLRGFWKQYRELMEY